MSLSLLPALLQVQIPRDGLSVAADVSIVVSGIALVALALALLWVLIPLGRSLRLLESGVRRNMDSVFNRAGAISDNVEFITDALRTDVQRINASVRSLSDRLQQASDHMERRIDEFNALMEVVQTEAEDLFLDTASTVHGVREGARSIGKHRNDLHESVTERLQPEIREASSSGARVTGDV